MDGHVLKTSTDHDSTYAATLLTPVTMTYLLLLHVLLTSLTPALLTLARLTRCGWATCSRRPISPTSPLSLPYTSPISPGVDGPRAQDGLSPLHLPYLSPIPRLYLQVWMGHVLKTAYLPYISPISALYLAYISRCGWTTCSRRWAAARCSPPRRRPTRSRCPHPNPHPHPHPHPHPNQLALVAYVPDAEHNKSASKIDVQVQG